MLETITIVARPRAPQTISLKVRILKSVADRHKLRPFQEVSADKALQLTQESKAAREGGATK